jgi:hypothetical protein
MRLGGRCRTIGIGLGRLGIGRRTLPRRWSCQSKSKSSRRSKSKSSSQSKCSCTSKLLHLSNRSHHRSYRSKSHRNRSYRSSNNRSSNHQSNQRIQRSNSNRHCNHPGNHTGSNLACLYCSPTMHCSTHSSSLVLAYSSKHSQLEERSLSLQYRSCRCLCSKYRTTRYSKHNHRSSHLQNRQSSLLALVFSEVGR